MPQTNGWLTPLSKWPGTQRHSFVQNAHYLCAWGGNLTRSTGGCTGGPDNPLTIAAWKQQQVFPRSARSLRTVYLFVRVQCMLHGV